MRFAALAVEPQVESALEHGLRHVALAQVPFERVRITIQREDGSVALDTLVLFPAGADSLTLALRVPLPPDAPASGVPMRLAMGYVNAAGDTVFKGKLALTVAPSVGTTPPPPVQVPLLYTGPGATAAAVRITPGSASGFAGQTVRFSAVAVDAAETPVPGTPIVFSSSDASVAVVDAASGLATLGQKRGSARITAQTLTGQSASASVTVMLPGSSLSATGGGTAPVGGVVPVAAVVTASDGVPVAGVAVAFAVATGGGSVSPTSATTDASGRAGASWKLGPTVGGQTLTVSAAGASRTLSATAEALKATKIALVGSVPSGRVGQGFGVSAQVQDSLGTVMKDYAGTLTVGLGRNPSGAALGGTTSAVVSGGSASFGGLTVSKAGKGYTVVVSGTGLASATSNAFDIAGPTATALTITAQPPTTVKAGQAFGVAVSAVDSTGAVVTDFTEAVALRASGPGTLSGASSVAAVAGVASFTGLAVDKPGTYTLEATSGTLAKATTSSILVEVGEVRDVRVVRGANQRAPANATLDTITLRMLDSSGNVVPKAGARIAVRTGGGTVTPTTVLSDANGEARLVWTLGPVIGPQGLTISVGTMPDMYVGATALGQVAKTLSIATPPPESVTAGRNMSPGIVLEALDSLGHVATNFTGAVTATIASGPTGAKLAGTVTADAVAGRATFNALQLIRKGTHTLAFGATGLASVTSGSVFVAADTARLLLKTGPDSLYGGAGETVTAEVRAVDAFGNGVAGVTVNFAASVGGSVSPASVSTDTGGLASTAWTLAAASGMGRLTASRAGLTGTFYSRLVGVKVWTGAVDTDWGTAGNWKPAAVPTSSDSVVIPMTVRRPVVGTGGLTVAAISVAPGMILDLGANSFAVQRSVDVGGEIRGSWTYALNVGSGVIRGTVPGTYIAGVAKASGPLRINGALLVGGSTGDFDIAGQTVLVTGNLATSANGKLRMQHAADSLDIGGNATFGGGPTWGMLTAGKLVLRGNFTQTGDYSLPSGAAFNANAGHTTIFAGNSQQTVSTTSFCYYLPTFTCSDSTFTYARQSIFGSVEIRKPSGGLLATTDRGLQAAGHVRFVSGDSVSVYMLSVDSTFVHESPGLLRVTSAAGFGSTVSFSPRTVLEDYVSFFAGWNGPNASGVAQPIPVYSYRRLNVNYAVRQLAGDMTIGELTSFSNGAVDVGARKLTVNGKLRTWMFGRLKMSDPAGQLVVHDSAIFEGGSTTGLLTAGTLELNGAFVQRDSTLINPSYPWPGSLSSFDAGPNHLTRFTGINQTIFMRTADSSGVSNAALSRLGRVEFAGTGTTQLLGSFAASGNAVIRSTGPTAVTGSGFAFLGGDLLDSTGGRWRRNLGMRGLNPRLPKRIGQPGDFLYLGFFNSVTLADDLEHNGYIIMGNGGTASHSTLDLNGHTLKSSYWLQFQGATRLRMASGTDTLRILGSALSFANTDSSVLTSGVLDLGGLESYPFGSVALFAPDTGVTLMLNPRPTGQWLSIVQFGWGASKTTTANVASSRSFLPRTILKPQPAGTKFWIGSVIPIRGQLIAQGGGRRDIASDTAGTDRALDITGADASQLWFDAVRLKVSGGAPITRLDTLTFQNFSGFTSGALAGITRAGNGTSSMTFRGWNFAGTLPTGLNYLAINDSVANNDTLHVTMLGATPASPSGFVSKAGGATLTWNSLPALMADFGADALPSNEAAVLSRALPGAFAAEAIAMPAGEVVRPGVRPPVKRAVRAASPAPMPLPREIVDPKTGIHLLTRP
jgi:hypothetical protein